MKKIALTFVAVAFGSAVAFAQSTGQPAIETTENSVNTLTIDRMSNRLEESPVAEEEETGRRTISEFDLPELVVAQLKYSKFAGHNIMSVTEVQPRSGDDNTPQYELILQDDRLMQSTAKLSKPGLLIRLDQFGEIVYQKQVPAPATANKEE